VYLPTLTAVVGVWCSLLFADLFFPHDISKTDAARITRLDVQMFRDESWIPIYFVGKCEVHESSKPFTVWVFAFL